MEQREEWLGEPDDIDGEEMDATPPRIDARMAAWISSVSPPAASRYLDSGLSLPEPQGNRPGIGEDWQHRAVADVLTECYATRMLDPNRERVEEVAISVMPPPVCMLDEDEVDARPFLFGPSPKDRWEHAVSTVSEKVAGVLRYGPSARFVEGEVLASGEEMVAGVRGLLLRQYMDLLWRYPDGSMEVVIVVGETDHGRPPRVPAEDWRVILAASIVHSEFGRIPEVHLVRVQAGVAQAVRPSHRHLTNSIYRLVRATREARESRDAKEGSASGEVIQNGFTYPLTHEAIAPLQRGDWPGGRPRPNRPGGPRR